MQRKKQIRFVAVLLISFLFTITMSLQAQVPQTISFQGLLTNPDGSSLPDGPVSLEIMLYEGETGGTAIWTETQSVNTKNSIFSAILGTITPLTAAFDKPYWVGIKVNGNSELVPRIALTSSPYSLGAGAVVSQPGPGQSFQVKDSSGIATHIINSNGDTWSAGMGTFGEGLVVGDTTVVPDTSSFSTINTNKIKFGINKTLGANVGGVIGRKGGVLEKDIGVFGWAKGSNVGVLGNAVDGPGVSGVSRNGPGVTGFSLNGDGILGKALSAGWAGHFLGSNVWIEEELKIDVVPSTTETSYLIWSSDHFVKVNTTPPTSGTFDGVLNNTPLIIKGSTGDDVITLPPSGPGMFNDGLNVPLNNGNTASILPGSGWHIKDPSGNFLAHNDPNGNAFFAGNVSKGGGSFKIDHPLDPLNKYLYHSFVESPDMMNIYNGNINLDNNGEATVELPNWFKSLNRDFRYQLTPIGAPALLYVSQEINDNTFKIAGGKAGMKVSWQVTGVRQDPYANLNRIKVEEDKPIAERGKYLHPDAYNQTIVSKQK